mmetsp:Transcript_1841/g.6791  ORF Transcript_1841/g.6791 Transcript_1841/m.6791 type:complete len:242 (-) Transcript_1841:356-1081(-)
MALDASAKCCITTRQYNASSALIKPSASVSRFKPLRTMSSSLHTSMGFTRPMAMSSLSASSASFSLNSTASAVRNLITSPWNASSQRLSISTLALRTMGARSLNPRRNTNARCAMDTDSTGTLDVSARNAMRLTSSATSRVLSTTHGMVKSEIASDPKIALRTSLFFSLPSNSTNACVISSCEKSSLSPPSCKRLNALAACARTGGILSRIRSNITSVMRSYNSSLTSASGPRPFNTPAMI